MYITAILCRRRGAFRARKKPVRATAVTCSPPPEIRRSGAILRARVAF